MPLRQTPEELRSYLAELRRIAGACQALVPQFRGLPIFTTATDAELTSFTRSAEELIQAAKAQAEKLLTLIASQPSCEEIGDLFALVAMEVQGKVRRLEELLPQEQLPIWEKAGMAMRLSAKVLKAATAVENELCEAVALPRELSLEAQIDDAIRVRQAYCKMWTSLPASQMQCSGDIEPRLRSAATAIARLTGRDVFLDMRFEDRRLLLAMQRRIRSWLTSGGASEGGVQLCQDVMSFFCLLAEINHRIELVIHDEALVGELLVELKRAPEECPLRRESLRGRFELLLGREIELDRILLGRDYDTTAVELLGILEDMARRWRRPDDSLSTSNLPPGLGEDWEKFDLSKCTTFGKEPQK